MVVVDYTAGNLATCELSDFIYNLGKYRQVLQRALPFIEARDGIGEQTVCHTGSANGIHIKRGAFDDDILGRFVYLGFTAAHHAADTDGPVARSNHNGLAARLHLFAVQRTI